MFFRIFATKELKQIIYEEAVINISHADNDCLNLC